MIELANDVDAVFDGCVTPNCLTAMHHQLVTQGASPLRDAHAPVWVGRLGPQAWIDGKGEFVCKDNYGTRAGFALPDEIGACRNWILLAPLGMVAATQH